MRKKKSKVLHLIHKVFQVKVSRVPVRVVSVQGKNHQLRNFKRIFWRQQVRVLSHLK